jgi:hypothetical protein
MNDNDQVINDETSPTTQRQGRLSSYNFLITMSKRMGSVATRSYVEVKQFLNQDITKGSSDKFLAGLSRIRSQKSSKQDDRDKAATDSQTSGEGQRDKEKSVEEGQSTVDSASQDLEKMINQSHEVLAEASTVFPVTLFPDTVIVDRTKVTIIKRDMFWSSDTMTFRIEDVLNAEVTTGPLFGSLIIASRVMSTTDHFRIDHFWRNDAVHLKRIIQGYVIAQHNKIDVAHLSKDELVKTLNELGHHRT